MNETKPCPFCGGIEQDVQTGTQDNEGFPVALICTNCGAIGPWEYVFSDHEATQRAAATEAWNRRI